MFIFDIDLYILSRVAPGTGWILNLRLLIIASVVVCLWLYLGHAQFFLLLSYVVAYPLIVIFWKLPKFIWKRWVIFIILVPTIYTTVLSLRTTLALVTAAALAATLIVLSSTRLLVIPSMVYLGAFLIVMLARAFKNANSSSVFSQLAELARKVHPKIEQGYWDQPVPPLETSPSNEDEPTEQEEPNEKFPQLYVLHVAADFIALKVDEVAKDKKYNLLLAASLISVFLLSATVFALLNWALFKIDPVSFAGAKGAGFLQFFAYSFGRLANTDIVGIVARDNAAIALAIVEVFCSILIIVIGGFSFLTAMRDTYREDFQEFDRALHETASVIEDRILAKYLLSAADLEVRISIHSAQLVNFLRRIRGLPEFEDASEDDESPPSLFVSDEEPDK